MEPTLPAPRLQESDSLEPYTEASLPADSLTPTVETAPNTKIERSREGAPTASQGSQPLTASPPLVTDDANSTMPVTAAPSSSAATPQNPDLADDTDVIEKEWVDRAKKIVSATRHDPHQQEKEVSRLQADYLMKRYGKQIKLTE